MIAIGPFKIHKLPANVKQLKKKQHIYIFADPLSYVGVKCLTRH